MPRVITIELASRNGYAPDQVSLMTVGELKEKLDRYDDDEKICVHNSLDCASYYGISGLDDQETDDDDDSDSDED